MKDDRVNTEEIKGDRNSKEVKLKLESTYLTSRIFGIIRAPALISKVMVTKKKDLK